MKKLFIAVMSIIAMASSANGAAPLKLTEKNIDQIVKQLTLEEKARLLVGMKFNLPGWGESNNPDPTVTEPLPGAAGNTAFVKRLGIPNTVFSDGPAGLNLDVIEGYEPTYSTAIPIASLISSSFDTEMARKMGSIVGQEAEDYGADVILGPGLNLMRSPLCGRNFEYYSEDPVLAGWIAAAYVDGAQSHGVGCSPKHFAANNQENNRRKNNAVVSPRALRELYLKPFEIMVKESKPWTIMSSYNAINGTYTQESYDLLETILRDEWGFDGLVMSDWTATRNTAAQMQAGNDLLMPGNAEQTQQIIDGVNNGTIAMADIDRNVKRMLQYIVKSLHFKGTPIPGKTDLEGHAAIVRKHAPEGMVLLQNNNATLPVAPKGNVALFGTNSYNFYSCGSGSGDVSTLLTVNLDRGLEEAGLKVDTLLSEVYSKYAQFAIAEAESEMGKWASVFWPRPRVAEPSLGDFAYKYAADRNDLAIITIARKSGEAGDRMLCDYALYPDEAEMIRKVSDAFHAAGKKVIVILNTGGAVATEDIKPYADAILLTWQPGVMGGNSVADVLTGAAYPSGKLPLTWAKDINAYPSTANFPHSVDWRELAEMTPEEIQSTPNLGTTNYDEDINVGYRYFISDPENISYPFGFGLGYTTFEYSQPKITRKGNRYVAQLTVTNTGDAPGREAVQLYVSAPKGELPKPAYELKSFAKTAELQPGQSETLTFSFTNYDLASFDEGKSAFVTDPGRYEAHFAASSTDIRQSLPFEVKGASYPTHKALLKK